MSLSNLAGNSWEGLLKMTQYRNDLIAGARVAFLASQVLGRKQK